MKTICIVGNSPHTKGLGLGSKIDSHDVVVRSGRFYCDPHDFGTKVTHWYLGPWILQSLRTYNPLVKTGKINPIAILDDQLALLKNSVGPKCLHLMSWSKKGSSWTVEDRKDVLAEISGSCSDVEVVQHKNNLGVPELLLYYPKEKNEISGVRIHPTTGKRLIHHYVSKYGKISIAGFGGGKENVKAVSASGYHDLETDYRLIDMLIDAGKVENIEGSHLYR